MRVRSSGRVTSLMYACAMLRLPAVMPAMIRPTNTIASERANPSTT